MMELTKTGKNNFKLSLAKQALPVIMAAIRENLVELEGEFYARLGVPESDVIKLADELQVLLDREGIKY